MAFFRPKYVDISLRPFGPLEMALPPESLLSDRKVVADANEVLDAWAHLQQGRMKEYMPVMVDVSTIVLAPLLPAEITRGRDADWSPVDGLSVGLTAGWSVPMMPGRGGHLAVVEPGVVRPGHLLAAFSLFNSMDDDELVNALLRWSAWMAFRGRVNNLDSHRFDAYLKRCARHSSEFMDLV